MDNGTCYLLFLQYLCCLAGRSKIVLVREACPFWLGQLLNTYLIEEVFFHFSEFTEILIKANLFRKVSRALIFSELL